MPVPDFSPGEVLTAAAMDSIGLWLVKTQTIGTAVPSVVVTDAFSANYHNYRIVLTDVVGSVTANLLFNFSGITSSTYFSSGTFFTYGSTVVNGFGPAASTSWIVAPSNTGTSNWTADVISPFATRRKTFMGKGVGDASNYEFNGVCTSTSSATGFVITPNAGTITGGTIRVYGYRN